MTRYHIATNLAALDQRTDRPTASGSLIAPASGRFLAILLIIALLISAGCVRRRMEIRTNPPGAMVYVDDYPVGVTPVATNFTYYGIRKIRLVKDGYQTLTVMQPVPPPWYQIPPLDFVAENIVPGEIRDHRRLTFNLVPQSIVPTETLLDRAEQLRGGMHPALADGPLAPVQVQPGPAETHVVPGTPSGSHGPTAPAAAPYAPVPMTPQGTPPPQVPPTDPGVGGQPLYPLPGGR